MKRKGLLRHLRRAHIAAAGLTWREAAMNLTIKLLR